MERGCTALALVALSVGVCTYLHGGCSDGGETGGAGCSRDKEAEVCMTVQPSTLGVEGPVPVPANLHLNNTIVFRYHGGGVTIVLGSKGEVQHFVSIHRGQMAVSRVRGDGAVLGESVAFGSMPAEHSGWCWVRRHGGVVMGGVGHKVGESMVVGWTDLSYAAREGRGLEVAVALEGLADVQIACPTQVTPEELCRADRVRISKVHCGKFVVLHNPTGHVVPLEGWTVHSNGGVHRFSRTAMIPAGESYTIEKGEGDETDPIRGTVVLRDAQGGEVDAVEALEGACDTKGKAVPGGEVLGVYRVDRVVDGDTVRTVGGGKVRVLNLDTEETFASRDDQVAAEVDFDAYVASRQKKSAHPVKYGTPMGIAAKEFATGLFAGASKVRLEKDRVEDSAVDGFRRTLAHVFILYDDGREEVNFGEAMIRAGYSPYYKKYGRSTRYHGVLAGAEREAIAEKRNIWAVQPSAVPRCYPDYDVRLAWWERRGLQVEYFRARQQWSRGTLVDLRDANAEEVLKNSMAAKEKVTVLGMKTRQSRSTVRLAFRPGTDFTLYFPQRKVFGSLPREDLDSLFVTATGVVTTYRERMQITILNASQVAIPLC